MTNAFPIINWSEKIIGAADMDAIAVLDVGKTNKKVLIYDKQLKILAKISKAFGEKVTKQGLRLEQPEAVFLWFLNQLKNYSKQFRIKAISITTHGAMGVCIDQSGCLTCPPLSYTNEPGQWFSNGFYQEYGDRDTLQSRYATAEIGQMINFAKMIHYWKTNCQADLDRTRHILFYPQYFGFLLTRNAAVEPTMLGCHTYLYDHKNNEYSDLAHRLGVMEKLPSKINNSWRKLGNITPHIAKQYGLQEDCIVTLGVHDSNASILPFLITEKEEFVLNSTGTWCVVMRPADTVSIQKEELGKTVFFNQDVFNRPVKTSIFMGGLEHETYSKLFEEKKSSGFNIKLYQEILEKNDLFILPSVMRGVGLFPHSKPRVIQGQKSYENFKSLEMDKQLLMGALTVSLCVQTSYALDLAGFQEGGQIFVEGGFRKNQAYCQLLTAFYPQSRVFKTNIHEATALGAAILGLSALKETDPRGLKVNLDIKKELISKADELKTDLYKKRFLELVEEKEETL